MPDFFEWIWELRTRQDLSRDKAAPLVGISASYLTQIETKRYPPEREVVDGLIIGYELNDMQARHLRELSEPPVDLAPLDELRTRLIASGQLEVLNYHQHNDTLAVYIDYTWHVLAANPSAVHAFPGLNAVGGNILSWFFTPIAQEIIVGWEHVAPHIVATAKAVLGRHRNTPRALHLLEQLRKSSEVNRLWRDNIDLAYGRPPTELFHWRDPTTGEPFSLSVQTSDHFGTQDIFLSCGFRRPYSGPPLQQTPKPLGTNTFQPPREVL
ncbi:helix-turn-helix domain-containing protein [Nocardia sp. CA-120079]|uniref:MmyB family transcriptional regulator n=1 Tax=Nocardia sp. CA-120079 TaxID=3239974 RepID=UPI003D995CA2